MGWTGFCPLSLGILRHNAARCKILLWISMTKTFSKCLSRTNPLKPFQLSNCQSNHFCLSVSHKKSLSYLFASNEPTLISQSIHQSLQMAPSNQDVPWDPAQPCFTPFVPFPAPKPFLQPLSNPISLLLTCQVPSAQPDSFDPPKPL